MKKYEIKIKLKQLLEEILSFPIYLDELREEDTYLRNLALDSFEMFTFMTKIEKTFEIEIDKGDIDVFIFQLQDSKRVTDIRYITIGDTIEYIYQKINYNFNEKT